MCGPLRINDPKEILRFLALILLLTPAQKASALHTTVVYRVLMQLSIWGARKRMRFIYRFVVGRPAPDPEPDFGVWFIADPQACPVLKNIRITGTMGVQMPVALAPSQRGIAPQIAESPQ